jgi:small subunit ribosomal protein S21
MEVVVFNGDIKGAMRILAKKLDKEGVKRESILRAFPKPSERAKEKNRIAATRRRKRERKRKAAEL